MEYLNVLAAAVAAYIFGAVWYMALAKPWVAATNTEVDENGRPLDKSPKPFIIAFVAMILVAGMMRHVFALSGIDEVGKGAVAGLGIGLFLASPWIAANVAFEGKPRALFFIDAGYASIGSMVIGAVLTMF